MKKTGKNTELCIKQRLFWPNLVYIECGVAMATSKMIHTHLIHFEKFEKLDAGGWMAPPPPCKIELGDHQIHSMAAGAIPLLTGCIELI